MLYRIPVLLLLSCSTIVHSVSLFGLDLFNQGQLNEISSYGYINELKLHPELGEILEDFSKSGATNEESATPLRETLRSDEQEWEFVRSKSNDKYQLRVKEAILPDSIQVDSVKQYSGYFDDEEQDKHLFYWFFESRNDPANDPVLIWLTGGPGGSSMIGLFFEMGPASVGPELIPIRNDFSWNSNASVIFIDEPVNVGFSHSSNIVYNSEQAAKDVYQFLDLFFTKFNHLKNNEFHLTGESYLGHYLPAIGHEILKHPDRSFNFKSVLIGNGWTDPKIQLHSYRPMACGEGGFEPVITEEQCDELAQMEPKADLLIDLCYKHVNPIFCFAAQWYYEKLRQPYDATGLNRYDIREKCENNAFCYNDMFYTQDFLNNPQILSLLGSDVANFSLLSEKVANSFQLYGDSATPSQQYIAELLSLGIPVLLYVGDKDYICNWLGNLAWAELLDWEGKSSFNSQFLQNWTNSVGEVVGEVKSFNNFTFLRVYDSGHMVPYDQPLNALEMLNRWTAGDYIFG